jgi:hypothetical protein
MIFKKAQGALEFLMTYGWAFLVILIMIGALAYFGVLNPSRFLPDRCDFGTQLLCKQHVINNCNGAAGSGPGCALDDPTFILQVTNSMGKSIYLTNATVSTDIVNIGGPSDAPATGATSGVMAAFNDGDADFDGTEAATGLEVDVAAADADNLWKDGETKDIVLKVAGAEGLIEGDKNKFTICFKYYDASAGPTFARDLCGEIYSAIQ